MVKIFFYDLLIVYLSNKWLLSNLVFLGELEELKNPFSCIESKTRLYSNWTRFLLAHSVIK